MKSTHEQDEDLVEILGHEIDWTKKKQRQASKWEHRMGKHLVYTRFKRQLGNALMRRVDLFNSSGAGCSEGG